MREEYIQRVLTMLEERKEIVAGDDGFYYYWPEGHGALSSADLRIIADELERRNAPLEAELEEYFSEHP